MKSFLVSLVMLTTCLGCGAAESQRIVHVRDYGVKTGIDAPQTANLQRALDDAAANGIAIELDAGTYVTGSLFLKSHTHLSLLKGAVLVGSRRQEDYPRVLTRAAGIEMQWPAALLNIEGSQDVSIEGSGTIDGDGKPWWDDFWNRVPDYESRGLRWAVDYDVQRPELIRIYQSNSVRIGGGLLLRRSAFWTVHICYSTHVVVSGVTIRDNDRIDGKGPSTDGVDIDSSRHVLVEKVDIENNDDGICLKAGMNADGLRVNRPTKDVVIRNSIIREGISGIAIGSDTAGGFRKIRIDNITILGRVRYGIYLKSTRTRGGWTEDVRMSHIAMHGVKTAIMIDLNYFPSFSTPKIPAGIESNLPPGLHSVPSYWHILAAPVSPERGMPHFHDVTFENIEADDVSEALTINAAPNAPLERFKLKDIEIEAQRAGSIKHTQSWRIENVHIRARDGQPLTLQDMQETRGTIQQAH